MSFGLINDHLIGSIKCFYVAMNHEGMFRDIIEYGKGTVSAIGSDVLYINVHTMQSRTMVHSNQESRRTY